MREAGKVANIETQYYGRWLHVIIQELEIRLGQNY